jgi:hypothetical protein
MKHTGRLGRRAPVFHDNAVPNGLCKSYNFEPGLSQYV